MYICIFVYRSYIYIYTCIVYIYIHIHVIKHHVSQWCIINHIPKNINPPAGSPVRRAECLGPATSSRQSGATAADRCPQFQSPWKISPRRIHESMDHWLYKPMYTYIHIYIICVFNIIIYIYSIDTVYKYIMRVSFHLYIYI